MTNFNFLGRCLVPIVENGVIVGGGKVVYAVGESITFSCPIPRDRLVGAETIMCEADGTWSPGLPECRRRGKTWTKYVNEDLLFG